MAHRSPARWLAPIALVAFLFALIAVVGSSSGDGESASTPAPNATATAEGTGTSEEGGDEEEEGERERKFYVVKLGDTPSQIADENGLTLEELQELNPDLDPQLMQTGDRIRLRK